MQVVVKGPSQRPCVICSKPNTRLVDIRDEEFRGSLCPECTWKKSATPIEKKNHTKENPSGSAATTRA